MASDDWPSEVEPIPIVDLFSPFIQFIHVKIIRKISWFYLLSIAFFLLLTYAIISGHKGDLLVEMNKNTNSILDVFFAGITTLGSFQFYLLVLAVYCIKFDQRAIQFAFLGAAILSITLILKAGFGAARPFEYFTQIGSFSDLKSNAYVAISKGYDSFPSGHTINAFAIWAWLAGQCRKHLIIVSCASIAILVGLSRVYLLAHFKEDVLAGGIIGLAIFILFEIIRPSVKSEGTL